MADTFIGMDVGDSLPVEITVAASTTSKSLEVRIANAATPAVTRLEAVQMMEAALDYIRTIQPWPA